MFLDEFSKYLLVNIDFTDNQHLLILIGYNQCFFENDKEIR